jgi:hypothetical protein
MNARTGCFACGLLLAAAAVAVASDAPASGASAVSRGRGPSHADEPPPVRIRLRLPAKLPRGASSVSMQVQIEENRFYRFNDLKPGATMDLGPLERGWNPFRLFNMRLGTGAPVPGLWCSGGFEAKADAVLQLSMVEESGRLRCSLAPAPPATAVRP